MASTISPGSDAIGSLPPSTEHSTSRPAAAASTIASGSCSNAVSSAAGSSASVAGADDPDRRSEPRRLDEHGQAERAQVREHELALGRELLGADRPVADLRQPGVGHQLLEHDLVHAQRRGQHAGADVGHVEALEQPLHGAVLAERSVQDREHDVDAVEPAPRLDRDGGAVAAPDAVAADLDRDRHVTGLLEPRPDRRRGGERYLVLGGAPSAEHRDAHGPHGDGVVVVPLVGVVDVRRGVVDVVGVVVVVVVVGVGAT